MTEIKTEYDNHLDLMTRYKEARRYWLKNPDMFNGSADKFLISVNRQSRQFDVTDRQMSVFCEIVDTVRNETASGY